MYFVPRREDEGLCSVWKIGARREERREGSWAGSDGGTKGILGCLSGTDGFAVDGAERHCSDTLDMYLQGGNAA